MRFRHQRKAPHEFIIRRRVAHSIAKVVAICPCNRRSDDSSCWLECYMGIGTKHLKSVLAMAVASPWEAYVSHSTSTIYGCGAAIAPIQGFMMGTNQLIFQECYVFPSRMVGTGEGWRRIYRWTCRCSAWHGDVQSHEILATARFDPDDRSTYRADSRRSPST